MTLVIGLATLIGWLFDYEILKRIHPSLVTMKANTSICLVLAAVSLLLQQEEFTIGTRKTLAQLFAAVTALVGLLTASEYLFGWNLGIDQLLFHESIIEAGQSSPGRMGIPVSLNLLLLGTVLLSLDLKSSRGRRLSESSVLTAAGVTLLSALYYFYSLKEHEPVASSATIGLHTAIALMSLSVGLLFARPKRELMSLLLGDNAGSIVARRMLPAFLIIVCLGWLRAVGVNAGLFGPALGTAAFVFLILLIFAFLIWWTASSLNQADRERSLTQEELRQRENELQIIVNRTPILFTRCGRDLRYRFVSRAYAELFGRVPEDFAGKAIVEIVGEEAFEAIRPHAERVLQGEQVEHESIMHIQGGALRRFSAIYTPEHDSRGEVVGWISSIRDTTDRLQVEEALRESQGQLAALMEQLPVGVGLVNREGHWLLRNSTMTGFVGESVPSSDSALRSRWQAWSADGKLLDPSNWPIAKALRGESVSPGLEMLHRTDEGREIWTKFSCTPFLDQDGEIVGAIAVVQDIDDQKRTSEAKWRLAAIVESSEDAIISKNLDGIITSWNDGAQRLFGYTEQEALGKSITILIPKTRLDEEPEIIGRIRRGERIEHYETVRQRKDGSFIDISLTVSPVTDAQGRIIGVSKIARDITARRQVEERLRLAAEAAEISRDAAEKANRIKDEFLATLSHELRSPLNVILGYSELLLRMPEVQRSHQLRKMTAALKRNAQAQSQLINDLLQLSRLEMNKLELQPEIVSLAAMLNHAIETVRAEAAAKEIKLTVESPDELLLVQGDPLRLQQIAWNLLNNAVKFTPAGGEIHVALQKEISYAVLTIKDTGQGIDPEFLPHVFEMFRQEDSSAGRRHGGLGIGLALVHRLVRLHRGTVSAVSKGLGSGAIFSVRLPLIVEIAASPTSLPSIEKNGLHEMKVLIVDDSEETLLILSDLLRTEGAAVTTAASAAEALRIATERSFDVILSDISMPGIDGFEFLSRLRKIPGRTDVPVLALTGFGRKEDVERARTAGFFSHLTKPLDIDSLAELLRNLANGSHESNSMTH